MLTNVSPIDGRYKEITRELTNFFSEYAYIKYRLMVEMQYLLYFLRITENEYYRGENIEYIHYVFAKINNHFDLNECKKVKEIEAITKHDVKAIEYYIRDKLEENNLSYLKQYIHFGLTSQDVNSVACMMSLKDVIYHIYLIKLDEIINKLDEMSLKYKNIQMLSRTHGQPASPTTIGKEIYVFCYRLNEERETLYETKYRCKFSGATGNWNAHKVAYPHINWPKFGDEFITELGLIRNQYCTQISNYDEISCILDNLKRINTIIIDLVTDMWHYISLNYFTQNRENGEIGSSTMPHKVNPINFENCEGNLIICNSLMECLSRKLPVSRLQRDLTDSTILRNMGTIFGHILISFDSLLKGLTKVIPNMCEIRKDLQENNSVILEGIQTILRREGIENAYEETKRLCDGNNNISKEKLQEFIVNLDLNDNVKQELLEINVYNYIGYSNFIT
jgi:adenylosuccinate lyase